jgi:hypothetical protein
VCRRSGIPRTSAVAFASPLPAAPGADHPTAMGSARASQRRERWAEAIDRRREGAMSEML